MFASVDIVLPIMPLLRNGDHPTGATISRQPRLRDNPAFQRLIDPRGHRKRNRQILLPPRREIGKGLRFHGVARPAEGFRQNDRARQPVRQFPQQGFVARAASAHDGAGRTRRQQRQHACDAARGEGGERRRRVFGRKTLDKGSREIPESIYSSASPATELLRCRLILVASRNR